MYKATKQVANLSSRFYRDLVMLAQPAHRRVLSEGEAADTPGTIKLRMDLGSIVDEMQKAIAVLEAAIRKEMR